MKASTKKSALQVNQLLKTAEGQLRAILSMYDEHRYCVEITKQILALQALLKKANNLILNDHIATCVEDAIENQQPKEKLKELAEIMALIQK
jgi:CsoR family transcriptional regulator, copper-sensing transcriptional repressor